MRGPSGGAGGRPASSVRSLRVDTARGRRQPAGPMLLADDAVSVFIDGTLTAPQLDHPEGLAVHPDGSIWCGGERGQIFRVQPDGSGFDEVSSTGGFCLGMAFDRTAQHLYVCDLKHAAVFRVDTSTSRA